MTQIIRNPVKWSDIQPKMTPAEWTFAGCLSRGERCRLGSAIPEVESSKNSIRGEENSIRGEVIRFFAYGGDKAHPVLGSQILLHGAWVRGKLDLSFGRISYALLFYRCHFDSVVKVIRAECPALYLSRSHLAKGLNGDGLRVGGGVFMRNGFSAESEVRLVGAAIGGNLNCIKGKFSNPGKDALIASQAKVKGGVFLSRKFSANGAVCLIGADIGENLNCADGTFNNEGKTAFSASRIKTGGDIMLNRGFSANGEVRLRGASIGGQLDCAGGYFNNPGDYGQHGQKQYALNAERVTTGGHVYLNKRTPTGKDGSFIANGRVRFANANIGGNFNCKGGQFLHSGEGSAIAAGGLKSRGAVFLSNGFLAKGNVALHVARIGNFVCKGCSVNSKKIVIDLSSTKAVAVDDDKKSWQQFKWILDGFTYDTFYGKYLAGESLSECLGWLRNRPKTKQVKIDGKYEKEELPFSPLPYEQAAKVLFRMGHSTDARKILLEKEQEITKRQKLRHKPHRWLWEILAGYGYKPMRTLIAAFVVVVIGTGVFWCADHTGHIVPHQPAVLANVKYQYGRIPSETPAETVARTISGYPEFNPFWFSLDIFVPLFNLHQEPFWYPSPDGGRPHWWRGAEEDQLSRWWLEWWYWIQIGFGWILTSLFLLSVTGLLRPRQSSGETD